MFLALFADRSLSPLRLAHFFTIIFRWTDFLSHIVNMACSSAISKEFSRKELLSLLSSVLDNLDDGKIKKLSEEKFKALFHFLNGRDTFACLPTGHGKTLIYQIAVLIARTGKVPIPPSNPLVVVVSPLNALISDQLESCQRLKLKAVKMEQELFALACLFTAKGLTHPFVPRRCEFGGFSSALPLVCRIIFPILVDEKCFVSFEN